MNSGAKGYSFPRITSDHMTKYNLCVPSKDEQETITECLSSLVVMIREKKKILEGLKRVQKGFFIQNKNQHA